MPQHLPRKDRPDDDLCGYRSPLTLLDSWIEDRVFPNDLLAFFAASKKKKRVTAVLCTAGTKLLATGALRLTLFVYMSDSKKCLDRAWQCLREVSDIWVWCHPDEKCTRGRRAPINLTVPSSRDM